MNKRAIFTICAKNYIGLAKILEKSIYNNTEDVDFYIFVADELSSLEGTEDAKNIFECKKILKDTLSEDKWLEMSFKYNLTEFCTSIKPFCFKYLFENLNIDKCIYLDPDILVLSSFEEIYIQLDQHKIILTPHINFFDDSYKGARPEKGLLATGVFNLGFLALRNNKEVLRMLTWWGERLKMQCYIDVLDSYFTDQRWMDFLPCFFSYPDLLISNHLGLNVAPWNFFERQLFCLEDKWFVRRRRSTGVDKFPLIFVHFSGYNYKSLLNGEVVQNNIEGLGEYQDIDEVCELYAKFLKMEEQTFISYISMPYSYSSFENGVVISQFARRIYRSLIEEGEILSNPFSTGKGSFYEKLKRRKLLLKGRKADFDKINKANMKDMSVKLKKINFVMRALLNLIGIKYYTLFLKLMRPYSRIENHIHLIDKKYDKKLM